MSENFWIEEGKLLAGRYPNAGTLPGLLAEGVTLFVDLTDNRDPTYERLLPDGVRRVSVPFADFTAGSKELGIRALDAILMAFRL